MPPPLRKLSQGKVEKSTTAVVADRPPPLKKTGSDKRFKLPTGDKSGRAVSEGEEEEEVELDDGEAPTFLEQNGGEDGEDDFELPPPMKPITEPILVATGNGPPGSTIPDELPGKRVSRFVFLFFFIISFHFFSYTMFSSNIGARTKNRFFFVCWENERSNC